MTSSQRRRERRRKVAEYVDAGVYVRRAKGHFTRAGIAQAMREDIHPPIPPKKIRDRKWYWKPPEEPVEEAPQV